MVQAAREKGPPEKQVQLGGAIARFDQPSERPILQIMPPGLSRGNSEHVKIIQVVITRRPQPFHGADSIAIAFIQKIAESQELPRLLVVWLVAHHRFEGGN